MYGDWGRRRNEVKDKPIAYQDDVERNEADDCGGGMGYTKSHNKIVCVIRVMVGEGA